jgi:peroxiredoxin
MSNGPFPLPWPGRDVKFDAVMALTYSEKGELGSRAPDFDLLGTDGLRNGLRDFRNSKVLVVVFMCNHCPYVKAVRGRINQLAIDGAPLGIQVIGINSNDSVKYPDDSFEAMKREASEHGFVFPYLWDADQSVARAYGAVCTPDFYVYRNETRHKEPVEFVLKYRGRLDDHWKDESAVRVRSLWDAAEALLKGQEPAAEQIPSMGCSIKWK